MKTTIDLPAELVRKLKLRAVREGRKLKELAAQLLSDGLAAHRASDAERPATIVKDKKTGLPVIVGRKKPVRNTTPEELAQVLIDQEAAWALGTDDAR
jgi:hypothetical protein